MLPAAEFRSRRLEKTPVRILMLEDDAAFAALVRAHLDRVSWAELQLEWVDTLAAALGRLADGGVDLIITDLDMPDSSGVQTVQALGRATDHLIIVLTGDAGGGVREAAIAQGAYDVLAKDRLDGVELERLVRLASMQAKTFRSLRESEERFRSLIELSSDWYWEQDEELRYLPRAGGKGALGGRFLPHDLGKRRWELQGIGGVTEEQWRAHKEALEARQPFRDFEYRRDHGGSQRWMSVSGEPFFDEEGRFKGYRGVGRDITERRRAEDAVRESEARFRSLTDLSSDFFWESDAQHRLSEVTHGPGHRPIHSQAAGSTRWDLPSVYPDAAGWARHKAAMDAHEPFRDFEFARIDREGVVRHVLVSGEPMFGAEGEFLGYRGIGRDVTARKHEARMLGLEHAVTRVLAEAQDPSEAVRQVIRAICEVEDWQGGRFFSLDEAAGQMRFGGSWSGGQDALERFIADSGKLGYARGEGLVGKAWESGDIEWTLDPGNDPRVKHPELARQAGLKASFAFPLHFEGRVCGVLSISSTMAHTPHGRFLKALAVIGSQLGQYLQRVRAEEEQRRFRAAIDASGDIIMLVDPATLRYVDANENACRRLGYARGELLAIGPREVLETPEDFDALYARLLAGERSEVAEGLYRCKDGSLLAVELNRQAVPSAGRHLIVVVAREITERKRAEQLLNLEHTVTRVLAQAESVTAGLKSVLREICETQGWECGRYFARDEADVFRFVESWHPPSAALDRFIAYSRQNAFGIGVGILGRAGAGEPQWVEDVALDERVARKSLAIEHGMRGAFMFPVTSDGRALGVLSFTSREVRRPDERLLRAVGVIGSQVGQFLQRKQAEQALVEGELRFRQTFELAGTGIAHVGLDRTYLRVNRRLCDVLGYAEHELVGRTVKEFSHPEDRDVMDASILRLRSGELPSVRVEKRYLRKDGAVVWVELTVALARNAAGEPQYEIALYEDITERKAAEDALRRFRAALDGSADMVFLVDLQTLRLLDFNDTACSYLGYARQELLGIQAAEVVIDVSQQDIKGSFAALLANPGRADSVIRTYKRKDGRTFETEVLRRVIDSPGGPILVLNARDLTERNLAQQRQALHVRYQEKIARFGESALGKRQTADLVGDAVLAVHEALQADAVVYVEPGEAPREIVVRGTAGACVGAAGPTAYDAVHPLALALEHGELAISHDGLPAVPFEGTQPFRSGVLVPVHGDERVQGALCVLSSRTAAFGPQECKFLVTAASVLSAGLRRIDSEGRLAFLAQFDVLTGLPNRALLSDRFSQMIVHARRHEIPLGVLFIDLDDFKLVNDTLGHAGGDELLKDVAQRLQASVRPGDTVARISGDEFAVILDDLAKADDAALVAQKIIDCLATPVRIRDQEVFVTASIGIAAFPADGDDAEALLGAADAAMYRAKQTGRNTYEFFTADINQRTRARAQLGVELRRALERGEFVVAYQPKFDLRTGQPCAAEALVRWRHPERGLVAPGEFIPVLEETGLIVPVGEWVLRRACEDMVAWKAAGLRQIPVAVNLSARQFRLQDLDARIRAIVAEAGVDPHLVELEITESQLMLDPEHAKRMMKSLSATGIRVAIDDFGTGYSSLSYLTRFPVSALKIDRSFVADVLKDHADAAIVRTIIDMAHTLGFIVIAEGVETDAQAALLRSLGCEQAQGYFFARPMPEAELRTLISSSTEAQRGSSRLASRYQ